MVDLKGKPFWLDDKGCEWIKNTLEGMTVQEKAGQLFCEILWDKEEVDLEGIFRVIQPGAVMYRPFSGSKMYDISEELQHRSKIPMLIACNLERGGSGGNGGLTDGTYMASPMGVAATNEEEQAAHLGEVAAAEGAAVGINWTFEPIVDIDFNCENPITNVRTYGSNPDMVIRMARQYMQSCGKYDMATTIKHFPGDGVDYRDQHLMASINSLSAEEWFATYGRVYQTLIDEGAPVVMSAHIKQPALAKLVNPKIRDEDILPASLSKELNQGILREKMGFNGLIVTDATQMVGFTASMKRSEAVPRAIANGADMFLFSLNQQEDAEYMLAGIENGILQAERLDEAVTRILALKASVKLHEKKENHSFLKPKTEALQVLQCSKHVAYAKECADKCVTLVKDRENILPLNPAKLPRIKLIAVTNEESSETSSKEILRFKKALETEGFQVSTAGETGVPDQEYSLEEYKREVDLIIYYANMKVSSNQTTIRIVWEDFIGESAPKYTKDIPTLFLSFSNPYHLVDVPMVQTYINAYSSNEYTVDAVVEKLMGRSQFTGVSPVDAFAGLWDTVL